MSIERERLEAPITEEELRAAVFKGGSKKSPGKDGIGIEFFKILWEEVAKDMRTLYIQMLRDRKLSEKQNKRSSSAHQNARNPKHQRIIGP